MTPPSTHTSREQFIRTIREALGRDAAPPDPPVPPEVDGALVRLAGPSDDLPAMFAERAGQVGMAVRRTSRAELPTQLLRTLREVGAKSVTLGIDRLPMKDLLQDVVAMAGVRIREWRGDRSMTAHYEVDAGVTDVHAALAETGTLICRSDAEHGRGVSLVPAVHIAIVRASDILPDMLDYMASVRGPSPRELPSAQAFITGPSKTADIEGILITGVHGPGRVFVLLVEDA